MEQKMDEQAIHFEVMLAKLSKKQIDEKLSKVSMTKADPEKTLFSEANVFQKML